MLDANDPTFQKQYPNGAIVRDRLGRQLRGVLACDPETGEVIQQDRTRLTGLWVRLQLRLPFRQWWGEAVILHRHGFYPAPVIALRPPRPPGLTSCSTFRRKQLNPTKRSLMDKELTLNLRIDPSPECLKRLCDALTAAVKPDGGFRAATSEDPVIGDGGDQMVQVEWWIPQHGCDSLENTLDAIKGRLLIAVRDWWDTALAPAVPLAQGEVAELVEFLNGVADWQQHKCHADKVRRAAELLKGTSAPPAQGEMKELLEFLDGVAGRLPPDLRHTAELLKRLPALPAPGRRMGRRRGFK